MAAVVGHMFRRWQIFILCPQIRQIRFVSCHGKKNLSDALNNYKDIKLIPYRIGACAFGESFSNATIQVIQYLEDRDGKVVRPKHAPVAEIRRKNIFTHGVEFRSIFDKAFKSLENYLVDENLPTDQHQEPGDHRRHKSAINSLKAFLDKRDFHEKCLEVMFYGPADFRHLGYDMEQIPQINEGDVTVLLANHMFSQLASNNSSYNGGNEKYIVTKDTRKKNRFCPCANNCGAEIKYGNTEFGSEYLWYGQTDIMVFPVGGGVCSIIVPPKREYIYVDEKEPLQTERQIIEVKSSSSAIRNIQNVRQIVSQAITFSFYQHKYQMLKQIPVCSLVPTIAACKDAFDIYMYDTENDVLLRNIGDPIPLFEYDKFNLSAIIQLWMLINHTSFSPRLNKEAVNILGKSCGLQKHLEHEELDIIMKTLNMKVHFEATIDPDFTQVYAKLISPSQDNQES